MHLVTKEITWTHPNPSIGEVKFEVSVREGESAEDIITLTGTIERACKLFSKKLFTFVNPSKKKFEECKTMDEVNLLIVGLQDAGPKADLISSRGTGNTAKAKEYDELKNLFNNPNATQEEKLAALAAAGFNI